MIAKMILTEDINKWGIPVAVRKNSSKQPAVKTWRFRLGKNKSVYFYFKNIKRFLLFFSF